MSELLNQTEAANGQSSLTDGLGAWKPLETAPRGSDNRFLGWDGEGMEITWVGWDDDGSPVYVYADWCSWEPTYWMPLPEAPNNQGEPGAN